MGSMQTKVEAVLAPHIDPNDPIQACDYGTLQGGSALTRDLKSAGVQIISGSSTAAHKAHDYVAVAVTARSVVLLRVKFKTGLLGMKFKPLKKHPPVVFPREQVAISAGQVQQEAGPWKRLSVDVQLGFPDGTSQKVQFYDNPQIWPSLAGQ